MPRPLKRHQHVYLSAESEPHSLNKKCEMNRMKEG